jgi:serine/threonine-protein kinase
MLASARGTRCFKAPEALKDFQADSCAGDVWAIGSTLYLLLTDRLPYMDSLDAGLYDLDAFKRPIIPPSRLNVNVDPVLDQIVFRSLALKPEQRYPHALELLADLEKWRPRHAQAANTKSDFISEFSTKVALGQHSPANEEEAKRMVAEATKLAREAKKLSEAEDLLEEALNKWPALREEYEYRLQLWRRGLTM